MEPQNFQKKSKEIRRQYLGLKKNNPGKLQLRLNLSWSNWGFGMEPLEQSVRRLAGAGIKHIELHGNHYGPDLGYKPKQVRAILGDNGVKTAGICGMFSPENDLSSNSGIQRQNALDYIRRELDFGAEMKADYMLIVPGAVGRPAPYDNSEFARSAETLRLAADKFVELKIKAAVEPIRSAEVSIVHTVADAIRYIKAVDHPGVAHINGDVYHMQVEESHIGDAVLEAGAMLTNLHVADSNRCALGDGSLDLDTLIMALYVIGFNRPGCYVTPEPLGPGGDPYPAMHGVSDPKLLDSMVSRTAKAWKEREEAVRSAS